MDARQTASRFTDILIMVVAPILIVAGLFFLLPPKPRITVAHSLAAMAVCEREQLSESDCEKLWIEYTAAKASK